MHRSVFEAAGGMEGMRRLAEAWHARVMADEVVSHAFTHGFHPQHTERLAAYWAEVLGGPTAFTDAYGDETSVVRMHSGNGVHTDMDERAIACLDSALTDAGLADAERLRQILHDTRSATSGCRPPGTRLHPVEHLRVSGDVDRGATHEDVEPAPPGANADRCRRRDRPAGTRRMG